ncbi:MAG: SoxR reducing system RseC family protein [Candidatus Aegiribacteria sp.]|nr:SoxR reducing system RseC family protein [Candidatus Aegiribacteria sp.]
MMKRNGIVLKVRDDEALVSLSGAGECDGCEARSACFSLSGGKSSNPESWMKNEKDAQPGDLVELELAPAASLTMITSTFLLPVLLLTAGYFFMMNESDSVRAMGAGVGLLVGIIAAVVINRRLGSKKGFNMSMTRILEKADCPSSGSNKTMNDSEGNTQ